MNPSNPKRKRLDIRIYFSDTDTGGIVYHANYLDFAERARTELCRDCGLDLKELSDKGLFFILRTANLDYVSPAKLEDLIEVTAYISKLGNTSLEFTHEFINKSNNKRVCTVVCTLVFVKVEGNNITPTPITTEISSGFFDK
jgi:acyl-CoA thioester hydrolase